MIKTEEVAGMIDAARVLHGATFPPGHLRLREMGNDVVVLRLNENGRPNSYVSDTVVMGGFTNNQRKAAVDLVVRCTERAHRRLNAVSRWNLAHGRRGDAVATWAVFMHEAVWTLLTRRDADLEKELEGCGPIGRGETPEMGSVNLRKDGSAYLYDAGWRGVNITIAKTTLPATVVQALPGRTLGETIAHTDLPADMLIRAARIQDGDLRIGLEQRYVQVSPTPCDADMAWLEIGVAPWQRTDFAAHPVEP